MEGYRETGGAPIKPPKKSPQKPFITVYDKILDPIKTPWDAKGFAQGETVFANVRFGSEADIGWRRASDLS